MKIGYFTKSNISISETFIYDLIKGLEKKAELTCFSGERTVKNSPVNRQIATGFFTFADILPFYAYKIGQLKGDLGYELKMRSRLALSNYMLSKIQEADLPDVAYVDYLTAGVLLRAFFERNRIPYVVHVHGYDISAELKDPAYKKEIKKVFASAANIIVASHYIKRLLILEGCSAHKIFLARYGVDTQSITPISWEQRLESAPSIIFLGRLCEKKNPLALIHAFNLVHKKRADATLTIIGDGPLFSDVQQLIQSLQLENQVSLRGALPREESFPIMNKHWIYAQHSVTAVSGDKEGFAISPAEAAAHELAVVSTLHNGIPEHVIDGETGFLVPEFDYESMAERIITLIENPQLAREMGIKGRENISLLNEPKKRIESIYALLETIHKDA